MRYRCRVIFALVIVALQSWAGTELSGRVVAVTDGDTIGVLVDKEEHKIRLHGIDTPERKQDFGTRARQYTSDLAFGKAVRVDVQYRDRYGREVGVVVLPDGRNLNHELVCAGFAWWYEEYAPKDTTLARLQRDAQQARRGLWRDANPQAPWDFRKQRAAERAAARGADEARDGEDSEQRTSSVAEPEGIEPTARYDRTPAADDGELVVIAPTGEKYHSLSCRHGRNGKRVMLESARREGYDACGVCGGTSMIVEER